MYYHYQPSELVHITDSEDDDGTTLCGLNHKGDVREVGGCSDEVLPTTSPYCQRCRAAYTKRKFDDLDVDVTNLDEGDVIEYWTFNDPTDPSNSLCVRKEGVITETPPWTQDIGQKGEQTIEDMYEVKTGEIAHSNVRFNRIWRVNYAAPEDVLGDEVGDGGIHKSKTDD